ASLLLIAPPASIREPRDRNITSWVGISGRRFQPLRSAAMELARAVRQRRMTRNFQDVPVDLERLRPIFSDGLRAPSAGFAQGVEFLVLTSIERRARFWELVAEPSWRGRSTIAEGLMRAPVLALVLVDHEAYRRRYAADDKVASALGGTSPSRWRVEYPTVDAGFAAMIVLLGVEEAGL